MSYKDKAVGEYRGGAIEAPKPPARRYPCFAAGCPMPGTIFEGVIQGNKHTGEFGTDQPGTCAWHYGVKPQDIPKVTRVLLDWRIVAFEVNEARRVLTGENCGDVAFVANAFRTAWERLQPLVQAEWPELEPGTIRTSKGVDTGYREGYGDWAKRLERFIGARVVEVQSIRQREAA